MDWSSVLVSILTMVVGAGGATVFARRKYKADVFDTALKPLREAIEFLDSRLDRAMADYRAAAEERDMWKKAYDDAQRECRALARRLVDVIEKNADIGVERDDARKQVLELRKLYDPQRAPSGNLRP